MTSTCEEYLVNAKQQHLILSVLNAFMYLRDEFGGVDGL